jgi:hypothetical protein
MHLCEYHGRTGNRACGAPAKILVQLYHTYPKEGWSDTKGSLMWFCDECWEAAQIHYTQCDIRWEF